MRVVTVEISATVLICVIVATFMKVTCVMTSRGLVFTYARLTLKALRKNGGDNSLPLNKLLLG